MKTPKEKAIEHLEKKKPYCSIVLGLNNKHMMWSSDNVWEAINIAIKLEQERIKKIVEDVCEERSWFRKELLKKITNKE